MKVLHLFSNHKWTGPAEPAVSLSRRLRDVGVTTTFACSGIPEGTPNPLAENARKWGMEPVLDFSLPKHFKPLSLLRERGLLADFIREGEFELLHTHQRGDHLLGGMAARAADRRIPVVRTLYDATLPDRGWRNRLLFGRYTDGLICVSRSVYEDMAKDGKIPEGRLWHLDTGVDLERFDPSRWSGVDKRREWQIEPDHFVFGIVARMQMHRRFPILMQAFKRLHDEEPNAHLVVVGGGTNREKVAHQPARELGLERVVHFVGYQFGDDYTQTLSSFDAKIFLVPGSDGSCRAVREAMAMDLPILSSREGMLPEMVTDHSDGLLVDIDAESLAEGMLALVRNRDQTRAMGKAARTTALKRYDLSLQTEAVAEIYRTLLP